MRRPGRWLAAKDRQSKFCRHAGLMPSARVSLELAEITLSRRWWWSRKATQSCSASRLHETPKSTAFTDVETWCARQIRASQEGNIEVFLNQLKLFCRFPCLLTTMQATATMNAAVDFLTRNFKAGIILDFDSPSPEDSCLGG